MMHIIPAYEFPNTTPANRLYSDRYLDSNCVGDSVLKFPTLERHSWVPTDKNILIGYFTYRKQPYDSRLCREMLREHVNGMGILYNDPDANAGCIKKISDIEAEIASLTVTPKDGWLARRRKPARHARLSRALAENGGYASTSWLYHNVDGLTVISQHVPEAERLVESRTSREDFGTIISMVNLKMLEEDLTAIYEAHLAKAIEDSKRLDV